MDSTELTKTIECLHCEKFFDCKGKPANVLRCNEFEERGDYRRATDGRKSAD